MANNWTKTQIVNALRERGTSAAAVAAAAGLSRFTLYSAMERPYPRVQQLIADTIGARLHDIWPLFYGEDGKRLSRVEQRRSGILAAKAQRAAA
jgi:Ner family transcriptional regulator